MCWGRALQMCWFWRLFCQGVDLAKVQRGTGLHRLKAGSMEAGPRSWPGLLCCQTMQVSHMTLNCAEGRQIGRTVNAFLPRRSCQNNFCRTAILVFNMLSSVLTRVTWPKYPDL